MNIPVFLASDDNYAPFVATAIASICYNTESFVNIFVLDGGITKGNKDKISKLKSKFDNFSLEFIKIDLEKEFSSIDYKNCMDYITLSTYSRFLIPQLKINIDKAFYSDIDIIAMGDIAEIYNETLNSYSLAAVPELYLEKTTNLDRKQRLGLSNTHKYFCAGGLLIDCEKWRQKDIFSSLLSIEKNHRDSILQADQDVLNIYFDNNYKILKPEHGVMDVFYDFHDIKDTVIRHFHGRFKPWMFSPEQNLEESIPDHKEFWKYAKMTDFYDDLYEGVSDNNQQNALIREFRLQRLKKRAGLKV